MFFCPGSINNSVQYTIVVNTSPGSKAAEAKSNMVGSHVLLVFLWQARTASTSFQVFNFGTADNLGTDEPEPIGSPDYLLWNSSSLPDGPFPSQFTLCFNMFYSALDYWSANQKTLLRIYQAENKDHFWMRVNHAPPRGTMIMNRANLWSGGLGDFRSEL